MSDAKILSEAFAIVDQPVVLSKKGRIVFMNKQAIMLAGRDLTGKSAALFMPPHIMNTQSDFFAATASIGKKNCSVKVREYEGYRVYTILCDKPVDTPADMFQVSIRSTLANMRFASDCIGNLAADRDDEKLSEYVCLLNRNYYRMKHSMDNVSFLSSYSNDEAVFTPEPLNMTALCRSIIKTVKEMYEDMTVSIHLNAEEDLRIVADRSLVEILLLNLLSNSISHCGKSGKINISLLRTDRNLILTVDDNGCGISHDDLSMVFDRYKYGIDMSRQQGSGMGLAVVRAVAELHKGAVIIESRGENKGTSVRVMLSYDVPVSKFFSGSENDSADDLTEHILTQMSDCLPLICFYGTSKE